MIGLWKNILFREFFITILFLNVFFYTSFDKVSIEGKILDQCILRKTNNISLPYFKNKSF